MTHSGPRHAGEASTAGRPFEVVLPDRWAGECNCLVGPFPNMRDAEHFNRSWVHSGHYGAYAERLRALGGHWYVEVHEVHTQDRPRLSR